MKKLVLLLMLLFWGSSLFAEEIPNGDGDLIWEQDIYPRFVRDAKFHPITGNIIAAVNHEIWEIDVKDGHKIRVFEGGPATGPDDQFYCVQITSDGKYVITGRGSGIEGLIIRDYESGKIKKTFINGENLDYYGNIGIFPDNNRIIYSSYTNSNIFYLNVYDIKLDSIIKRIQLYVAPYRFTISKDGKYLALGSWNKNSDKHLMELWDAETLTHIRDFGEAFSANEFWDVKISNDNQYVGFVANNLFWFYDINGKELNLTNKIKSSAFCFNNESTMLIFGGTSEGNYNVKVKNIQTNTLKYQYLTNWPHKNFTVSQKNELFAGQNNIKLFSNRWFTVDVKDNQIESIFKINYSEKKLIIENSSNQILKSLEITDINGKFLHTKNLNQNSQSTLEFEFKFIPGVYFATIHTENGKTYSQKFMVVE